MDILTLGPSGTQPAVVFVCYCSISVNSIAAPGWSHWVLDKNVWLKNRIPTLYIHIVPLPEILFLIKQIFVYKHFETKLVLNFVTKTI